MVHFAPSINPLFGSSIQTEEKRKCEISNIHSSRIESQGFTFTISRDAWEAKASTSRKQPNSHLKLRLLSKVATTENLNILRRFCQVQHIGSWFVLFALIISFYY